MKLPNGESIEEELATLASKVFDANMPHQDGIPIIKVWAFRGGTAKIEFYYEEHKTFVETKYMTNDELLRAKIEAETELAWAKYPEVSHWVDFALCGQMPEAAIRELPLSELPKIVNEAIAMFGEELEEEIKDTRSSVDYTDKHKAFLGWLETYPVL